MSGGRNFIVSMFETRTGVWTDISESITRVAAERLLSERTCGGTMFVDDSSETHYAIFHKDFKGREER